MLKDDEISSHRKMLDYILVPTQSLSQVSSDVPTFSSVCGNSVTDLNSLSPEVKVKLMRHYIDDDVELFTGAPRRKNMYHY